MQDYFKDALKNFTFEIASKDAICHLADRGFTVDQIMKILDFPTPRDRVGEAVWEHLLDTGYILLEEPGLERRQEDFAYVTEYDPYGRKSFRRVTLSETIQKAVCWNELDVSGRDGGAFAVFLSGLCAENGEDTSYVSCEFGLESRREPERFLRDLQVLDTSLREYILGIPWERRRVYHRLDRRMRDIVVRLYEHGSCHGTCYFIRKKRKVTF